jgi:hypothetical protein
MVDEQQKMIVSEMITIEAIDANFLMRNSPLKKSKKIKLVLHCNGFV